MPRSEYFAEVQFRGLMGDLYWLPLYITAPTLDEAEGLVTRFATGLRQNYRDVRPSRVTADESTERIEAYRQMRARGRPHILRVTEWQMRSIDAPSEMSFSEATDAEIDALFRGRNALDADSTLATGEQRIARVHVVEQVSKWTDEFLLINVVMPQTPSHAG